jgi:hypothetical protein
MKLHIHLLFLVLVSCLPLHAQAATFSETFANLKSCHVHAEYKLNDHQMTVNLSRPGDHHVVAFLRQTLADGGYRLDDRVEADRPNPMTVAGTMSVTLEDRHGNKSRWAFFGNRHAHYTTGKTKYRLSGKIFNADFFFHLLTSAAIKPAEQTSRRLTSNNDPFATPPKPLPKKP